MPKYRLDNGRTEAAHLNTSQCIPNLIPISSQRISNLKPAQNAQHEILSTLINEKDLLP